MRGYRDISHQRHRPTPIARILARAKSGEVRHRQHRKNSKREKSHCSSGDRRQLAVKDGIIDLGIRDEQHR
jgi:hypothetical protein